MKTTLPSISYRKFEGLTQDQVDTLLAELNYSAYEIITESVYDVVTTIS